MTGIFTARATNQIEHANVKEAGMSQMSTCPRTAPVVAQLCLSPASALPSAVPISPSAFQPWSDALARVGECCGCRSRRDGVAASPSRFRTRTPGVVYVTTQGLYYDTFVVKDPLPMEGRFQLIVNGTTEFGPGQPGYLGGRWWEDVNGNGVQDAGDHFFLCPLPPPGRPTP